MCEEIEPGLEGFSDSGSDFYDLPVPELPNGIERKLLKPAYGVILKRPEEGDEVEIHYVVRSSADDRVLDSTKDSGKPKRFIVGRGDVCYGLDHVVRTMRLGEKASFNMPATMAGLQQHRGPVSYEVDLLNWVSCRDLLGDGSAVKRVLQRAQDKRRTKVGQVCLLSLRLSLASSSGGEPSPEALAELPALEYTVGGEALSIDGAEVSGKLLDEALLSMRRGEHATLHAKAAVAFAEGKGLPPGVQDESELVFELQLREFLDTVDISFEKDATVMKRSLSCRDAWVQCQDAGKVSMVILSVRDGGTTLAADQRLDFTVGNGEVCDALECAAACMREGEEAVVTCSLASMCEEPRLGLPGHPDLAFHLRVDTYERGPGEVTRHSGEKVEWYRARKDRTKFEYFQARRDNATALYKAGRHRLAAYLFRQIYELLGYLDDYRGVKTGDARKAEVAELKKVCLLNRALCALKDGNHHGALSACEFVLDGEPQNSKALFRRAQALLGLERCDEALRDVRVALRAEPKDPSLRKLAAKIQAARRADDGKTQPMYVKMCDALGSLPHPLDVD